jgi:hypothetical protein
MNHKIPLNVKKILNGENIKNETILYENNNFILLLDLKNSEECFHYTAWYKFNISSLKYITFDILDQIFKLKFELISNKIIEDDTLIFIHYPPQFYRLHIHFVSKNHDFEANEKENFLLDDIYNYIKCKL